jgi:molybdopterin-guanine dinucleotide biosynthesis protein A
MIAKETTVGLILCGGRASRMGGGDKSLLALGQRTIMDFVVQRLSPQVGRIAISANGDPSRFARFALPVLADPLPGNPGPLAGILAGMEWVADFPGCTTILSVAGDTPFFPPDLALRLADAADRKDRIAVAASEGRRHPVFALWPVSLRCDLRDFIASGQGKVSAFMDRHGVAQVDFPSVERDSACVDPFFNINTPEDLASAKLFAEALEA